MASAYIPTYTIEKIYIGNTSIVDPLLLLSVGGVVYANGYKIDVAGGVRNFFPSYDPANGNLYVVCNTVIYSSDTPSITVGNLEVLVIG